MQKKPYLLVLNNGSAMQDLGQRKTVTPAGNKCPSTPGSRFPPVKSRVCQRDSSNLRHRILLVSELKQVQAMSTTTSSFQCQKQTERRESYLIDYNNVEVCEASSGYTYPHMAQIQFYMYK